MPTIMPVDLIVGTTPATGLSATGPQNTTRLRANNWTNQWVHITSPVDQYIAPFAIGISYGITLPTMGYVTLTALFAAPPGWTQAATVAGQICRIMLSDEGTAQQADNSAGSPSATPNVYVEHFEDNVDPAHPYTARFYIPTAIIGTKDLLLSYLALPYRYYVSTVVGGSGGGVLTSNAPGHLHGLDTGSFYFTTASTHNHVDHSHADPLGGVTAGANPLLTGQGSHDHTYNGGTVSVTHSHTVDTTHTHSITVSPGVVEELTPTSWTIAVDGNAVTAPPLNGTAISILAYVTKDVNGNPAAGYHTIQWTPNQRGRLQADLSVLIYLGAL